MKNRVKNKTFEDLVNEDIGLLSKYNVTPNLDDIYNFQKYSDSLPSNHGCHSYVGRGT